MGKPSSRRRRNCNNKDQENNEENSGEQELNTDKISDGNAEGQTGTTLDSEDNECRNEISSAKKLTVSVTQNMDERVVEIQENNPEQPNTAELNLTDGEIRNEAGVNFAPGATPIDKHGPKGSSGVNQGKGKRVAPKVKAKKQKISNKEKRYQSPPRYDTEQSTSSSEESGEESTDSESVVSSNASQSLSDFESEINMSLNANEDSSSDDDAYDNKLKRGRSRSRSKTPKKAKRRKRDRSRSESQRR